MRDVWTGAVSRRGGRQCPSSRLVVPVPPEQVVKGLPRPVVLLRVRGTLVQYLAAHGLPAESGCRRRDGLRTSVDRRRMHRDPRFGVTPTRLTGWAPSESAAREWRHYSAAPELRDSSRLSDNCLHTRPISTVDRRENHDSRQIRPKHERILRNSGVYRIRFSIAVCDLCAAVIRSPVFVLLWVSA